MAASESRDAARDVVDTMNYALSLNDADLREAGLLNTLEAAEKALAATEKVLYATRQPSDSDFRAMQYAEGGYRPTRKLRNRSKRNNKKKGKSRRAAK
jgi:hypothetical protein